MSCDTRCPLENQSCDDCTNNEPPADGPDPDMLKPSARDYFRAGTWGM